MTNVVYHGSPLQGLNEISPRVSTHKASWVYATRHPDLAALFIANIFGDCSYSLDYSNSLTWGLPVICEKFNGAFELAHGSETKPRTGSIYTLDSKLFQENKTGWAEDLVSSTSVKPIDEFKISDVYAHLVNLEKDKRLAIIPSNKPFEDSRLYFELKSKSPCASYIKDLHNYHPSIAKKFNFNQITNSKEISNK